MNELIPSPASTEVLDCLSAEEVLPRKTFIRLSADQQQLALTCIRWAWKLSRRFARKSGIDHDECESIALEYLCRAAHGFDPTRGLAFSSYVTIAVRRGLRRLADQVAMRRRELRFADLPESHFLDPADRRPPRHTSVEDAELLREIVRFLEPRVRAILWRRIGEGASLAQVAREQGICHERVRALVGGALSKCRKLPVVSQL